jgi:hypothetical protein
MMSKDLPSHRDATQRAFVFASLMSAGLFAVVGAGSGFGIAVGFMLAGLVMPILGPALLLVFLLSGESWPVVDNNPVPRPLLAALAIVVVVASLWLLKRASGLSPDKRPTG